MGLPAQCKLGGFLLPTSRIGCSYRDTPALARWRSLERGVKGADPDDPHDSNGVGLQGYKEVTLKYLSRGADKTQYEHDAFLSFSARLTLPLNFTSSSMCH